MGKVYTKYKMNEDYFKKWSADVAYIIGYITADGCLSTDRWRLAIDSIDIQILETIRDKLESDVPIKIESNSMGQWYKIAFYRKEMVEGLIDIIGLEKTFQSKLPKGLPKKYIRDYIRGIFDGDGSIYSYEKTDTRNKKNYTYRKAQVEIASASVALIEELYIILNDKVGHFAKLKSTRSKVMTLRSGYKIEDFYEYIYYNECIRLERKKVKFDEEILYRQKSPKIRKIRVKR